jgi:hypothetical protein
VPGAKGDLAVDESSGHLFRRKTEAGHPTRECRIAADAREIREFKVSLTNRRTFYGTRHSGNPGGSTLP